ncbi:MAG: PLP-dependent transferase [Bacteroidetes bacterium]|nr:PLP-dependent transferase [Bacteroidota bacterium]
MIIDLRSDTVTKPTVEMMEAIMSAKTGDDVFREDPTAKRLEEKMAVLFGMDEALYFPTGSMSNQAAIKLHTQPGEQLICDSWAHIYNYEAGGAAFNSGVSCKLINGDRGMINAEQVESSINPPDFYHSPLTSLVCLENTTNKGGGACYDFDEIVNIKKVCDKHDLGLHLDGARLMNAIVAKKEDPKEYGKIFDSISICLSKGLGAPLGTVLLGNKDLMRNAVRIRKIFGGAMRQIGFMAAAGLYGIEHLVDRMAEDHKKASEIAKVLEQQEYIKRVEKTETNIVIFYLNEIVTEDKYLSDMHKKNIKISNMGQGKLRIVTHYDYTQEMHEIFLEILNTYQ